MKIYLVATIQDIKEKGIFGKRVLGYFEDLEVAKKCVEENWYDIYEHGYYKYAVIEDIEPGIYMSDTATPIFYKWVGDIKTGCYKKIKKPAELKGTFGFTIG